MSGVEADHRPLQWFGECTESVGNGAVAEPCGMMQCLGLRRVLTGPTRGGGGSMGAAGGAGPPPLAEPSSNGTVESMK